MFLQNASMMLILCHCSWTHYVSQRFQTPFFLMHNVASLIPGLQIKELSSIYSGQTNKQNRSIYLPEIFKGFFIDCTQIGTKLDGS